MAVDENHTCFVAFINVIRSVIISNVTLIKFNKVCDDKLSHYKYCQGVDLLGPFIS